MKKYKFKNKGYCVCCDKKVFFVAKNDWLRDFYIWSNCKSIPRERALMFVIEKYYPDWKNLKIHESSPIERGTSLKLKKECKQYIASQYWPEKKGVLINGFININFRKKTF